MNGGEDRGKQAMAQDTTRFQLSLHGISLELSGERDFVEEMYREIMRDIEVARARMLAGQPSGLQQAIVSEEPTLQLDMPRESPRPKGPPVQEQVIWLHRCSELVHKIYMTSASDLARVMPLRHVNKERIATLYVEDKLLSKLMPQFDRGQTLWAELTRAGRKKIAEASLMPPPAEEKTERLERSTISPGLKGESST